MKRLISNIKKLIENIKYKKNREYEKVKKNLPEGFDPFDENNGDIIKDQLIEKTEYFNVITNVYPYEQDHIMIVPKRFFMFTNEMKEEELKDLNYLVMKYSKIFLKIYGRYITILRQNTTSQSVKRWHQHIFPDDKNLDIKRVEYNGLSDKMQNEIKMYTDN